MVGDKMTARNKPNQNTLFVTVRFVCFMFYVYSIYTTKLYSFVWRPYQYINK